jgi:hypothetical protein
VDTPATLQRRTPESLRVFNPARTIAITKAGTIPTAHRWWPHAFATKGHLELRAARMSLKQEGT